MGWSIGWSRKHKRWIGYGVPCICEHPECNASIDRGMDYLCPKCRLAFCGEHGGSGGKCPNCEDKGEIYPVKPESTEWLKHLRSDDSWAGWRASAKNMAQLEAWEAAAKEGVQ